MEQIRKALTLIASIPPYYTINVNNMTLMPHRTISSAARRMLMRENRHKTLDRIEEIIDMTLGLLKKELDLVILLKNTKTGLQNLKETTYASDKEICYRIDGSLKRIENACTRVENQIVTSIEQIPRCLELLQSRVNVHEYDDMILARQTPIMQSPQVQTPDKTPIETSREGSAPPTPPSTPQYRSPIKEETLPESQKKCDRLKSETEKTGSSSTISSQDYNIPSYYLVAPYNYYLIRHFSSRFSMAFAKFNLLNNFPSSSEDEDEDENENENENENESGTKSYDRFDLEID